MKVTFNSFVSFECHKFLKIEAVSADITLKKHISNVLEDYYNTKTKGGNLKSGKGSKTKP